MFQTLRDHGASVELSELVVELANAIRRISEDIVRTSTGKAGTQNSFGEEQAAMDVRAEEIVQEHLKSCPFVAAFGSEELDELIVLEGKEGRDLESKIFSVFYDPLDGSSLLDVNFSVGTIIGIYEGSEILGRTGREQVAAIYGLYGVRTALILTVGDGVMEFVLTDGEWTLSTESLKLTGQKNYFAPGNLRATKEREDYFDLVAHFMKDQYTLRYSGGMVPDIHHILKKGSGVFMYPGMPSAPNGKLRLLYECAPMAMIMEQAGGAASNGSLPILDVPVESLTQRSPIFIGQERDVKLVEQFLN